MPTARRPPWSVLAVGVLFLALGCFDAWLGFAPLFRTAGPGAAARFAGDDAVVVALGLVALTGGAFLLYGRNWARWLLAAWMAFHVANSVGDRPKLAVHAVIFGIILLLLFRPGVGAWFRPQVE